MQYALLKRSSKIIVLNYNLEFSLKLTTCIVTSIKE